MENQELVTIIQAAHISGKSIQTIRRMIKQKKIRVRKQRTPQGFNYLIIKESLHEFMEDSRSKAFFLEASAPEQLEQKPVVNQAPQITPTYQVVTETTTQNTQATQATPEPIQMTDRDHRSLTQDALDEFKREVGKFNTTIQQLIEQSSRDKSNFFDLIKTFQDRVIILENQIKQLEAPKSSWWKLW